MQTRQLFLASLLLGTPTLAFPSFQDREAPPQEVIELAEQVRAQVELVRVEAHSILEQAKDAQEGVGLKLSKGQDADRGYLGIEMAIGDGVTVVGKVMPGSGADKAGLQAGDRILRVNKIKFDQEDAEEKLASLKAGKKAKVIFERDGEEEKVTVSLSPLSAIDQGGEARVHVNRLRRVTEAEGDGEHVVRMRLEHDSDEGDEDHDVRILRLGNGDGTWVMKEGDRAAKTQRRDRVELRTEEGGGRHMSGEIGFDLEGLPEHVRELIREHDAEEHDVRVLHLGGGGGRDLRLGDDGDLHVEVEVNHDGHRDHDGPEINGKAIIKMLTGDGERRMELDFDGSDLREMGGRVRQMMAGRDFDMRDILARVRGNRSEGDPGDHHRGEDHGGRGDHDPRDQHREEDHGGRGDHDPRDQHRGEDHGGRGDHDPRDQHRGEDHGGRRDHDPRDLHREEDHDRRGDRDPRDMRREQDRRMNRPQAFGRGRGMGMTRGRGRGGPDMFPHEEHDDDHGEFEELEERIEELEERIEELEALLERFRGRRNR